MTLSRAATFRPKSEGPATWTPFTLIQAEETRWLPSASPFWMWRQKGATTEDGTGTASVYTLGAPPVRRYFRGPKKRVSQAGEGQAGPSVRAAADRAGSRGCSDNKTTRRRAMRLRAGDLRRKSRLGGMPHYSRECGDVKSI